MDRDIVSLAFHADIGGVSSASSRCLMQQQQLLPLMISISISISISIIMETMMAERRLP